MHSLIDVIGGLIIGMGVLAIWLSIHEYIDAFVVSEQNGQLLIPFTDFRILRKYLNICLEISVIVSIVSKTI